MKLFALPLITLSALVVLPSAVHAQNVPNNWEIRARVVQVDNENKSSAGSAPLSSTLLPADAIHVENKTSPEIDVTYFFDKNFALEWVLAYPTKHGVTIASGPLAENIGRVKATSTLLTFQYHFLPEKTVNPYIGAGVGYTRFSSVNLRSNIAFTDLSASKDSVGGVFQVGADIKLSDSLYLNFDIKKYYLKADVKFNGSNVSEVKIDPFLYGVGLGLKF